METPPVLEIKNLNQSFGSKNVLKNVSLSINEGEFVSLLGPSGCGKTSLLRIIAGHDKPVSGQVLLSGRDITLDPPHRRPIHTVFQRYALFPHMNIYDNVAFGLRCEKVSESEIKAKVEEVLALVNLKDQGHRRISTLSGGEQQRVALVRALVNHPKLLLLDEPLGALDLKLRLQLQQELVAIQKKFKTTFVFVTHDQQEALNMSDRIILLNGGVVEQAGTPHEIYETPKSFFAAHFVGNINVLDKDDGKLCIRPEKINIYSKKPTTMSQVFEGRIKSQSYLGMYTQFEVLLKNGAPFMVFQQNSQKLAKKAFKNDDDVYLGWQDDATHFFKN